MEWDGLVKRLRLPDGELPPRRLTYEDVVARAITRDDLEADVRGINASIDLIRRTRGGAWPSGPVTAEENYVDLVWHECEFRDGKSFTYALYTADADYLGCCYLYPMGTRTPLSPELLHHDVDVSWWVTPEAYEAGFYRKVHDALRHWLAHELPFAAPYLSNAEVPAPP